MGGVDKSYDSLRQFQKQLEGATPKQLEKSVIHKTKEGYKLEKLTLGTRICRIFKSDEYNTQKNVSEIIELMQNCTKKNPLSYKELATVVHGLHHFSTRKGGQIPFELFKADLDFSTQLEKILTEITGGKVRITTSYEWEAWKKKLALLEGHPLLNDEKIQDAITTIAKQREEKKSMLERSLLSESQNVLQNPWEHAMHFTTALGEYSEFATRGEADDFRNSAAVKRVATPLRAKLLDQLQKKIKPVQVSIRTTALQESHPLQGVELKDATQKDLVDRWASKIPDFKALRETFGRIDFAKLKLQVNKTPLPLQAELQKQFPGLTSGTVGPEAVKAAFLCEALFNAAKEAMPTVSQVELDRVVAETITLCVIDHNPIGTLPAALLSCFQLLETGGADFFLQESDPFKRAFDITFLQRGENLGSTVKVSSEFGLLNLNKIEEPSITYRYTSELHKNFRRPQSDWSGTLSKSQ